jgi:hypothetical protein
MMSLILKKIMKKDSKQIMPALFMAFLAYTVIYHVLMFQALQKEAVEEDCNAQAHAGGIISPHCLELEVFRDWHKKGTEELLEEAPEHKEPIVVGEDIVDRSVEETKSKKIAMAVNAAGETLAQDISDDLAGLEKKFSQLVVSSAHLEVNADKEKDGHEDDMLKGLEERKEHLARFDQLEKEVRKSLEVTSVSPWAKDLMDLQSHLEKELKEHDSNHHGHPNAEHHDDEKLSLHRQAELDKLKLAVQTVNSNSSAGAPWAKDLEIAKSHIIYKMATHTNKLHGHSASEDHAAELEKLEKSIEAHLNTPRETPWARDLKKLQQRLEFEMHAHSHHHHGPEAALELAAKAPVDSSDPLHKWAAGVHEFHSTHEQIQARHAERVTKRAQLTKEIGQRMDKLENKLAGLVSDRKVWESTLLHKYDAANTTGHGDAKPSSPFMSKRLQWSNIPALTTSKVSAVSLEPVFKQPIVVSKRDVRHLHWTGDLPKVSAITWIKSDRRTRARMMYFVDNFNLQDYEGPHELVFVYHYKDIEAAELVRHYADRANIRSIAAHDFSQDLFPSDPALRYAAWESDASVIAQWDFDAWHDPSSLAMQVRAMAYTAKHACVLSMSSTSHSQEDDNEEISLSSVVGERLWMKEHWHPFSKRKLEVTETFKAGQLVELDMQNKKYMSSISRIEHVFNESQKSAATADKQEAASPAKEAKAVKQDIESPAMEAGHAEGTQFSHDISECLGYDHNKGHEAEDAAAGKAISENVGPDFGKKFHDLVKKRHDITLKLQLLCFQTSSERDVRKRKFMHEHVLEMDRIRNELDKHVKNTASVFGVSALK